MFRSQASGAFFDIAGMVEGFHASCLDLVSFPFRMLPLSSLSASFVERNSIKKTARVTRSVLVRSNNRRPSGPLRFVPGPKPPRLYFIRLEAASHRLSSLGSIFAFRTARERPPRNP